MSSFHSEGLATSMSSTNCIKATSYGFVVPKKRQEKGENSDPYQVIVHSLGCLSWVWGTFSGYYRASQMA